MVKSMLYNSGDLFLREKYKKFLKTLIWGSYDSMYINYWSILHLISGIATYSAALYLLQKSTPLLTIFIYGWIIHSLWELWQIFIGMTKLTNFWAVVDIAMDTLFFTSGMFFAHFIRYCFF